MNTVWPALFPFTVFFAAFFAWLLFFRMGRREVCPDCNKPLSPLQSPFTKTRRQWVEGGKVCQNCGCETDSTGEKVPAGTAPSRRSLILGIGLLTLTAIPAVVLLTMLLHR